MGLAPLDVLFTFPTRVRFGEGVRRHLDAEASTVGMTRPLWVSDRGIVDVGLFEDVSRFGPVGPKFVEVQGNPTELDVLAGLEIYRREKCDGVIAVGGGSPIDAAKAIRLLATHAGTLDDYDATKGGQANIRADLPPMIAVPTTAGTGSEVGRGALIQTSSEGRKIIVLSQFLLPTIALVDPETTYGLPPVLTAATGMDAFTHAIESYLSTTFHPICDGIALEALQWIGRGLEASVIDGTDRVARRAISLGALMAGISFHKGLGVVHSLSHALGATGRVHHGTLNAVLLPHALRFNMDAAMDRMRELAGRMGLSRSPDAVGHLIVVVDLLLRQLPLPRVLGDVPGLDRSRIPRYAELAERDHCHRSNPRICTRADFVQLLEAAW